MQSGPLHRSGEAARSRRRTRLVRQELELGAWTRAVCAPDPRLAPLMYRNLLGFEQSRAGFSSWLEPPRPALTLMIDLDGSIAANGAQLPDAWIAGIGEAYTLVELGGRYASLDLELTPLGAYRVLGRPLWELRAQIVSLEELFGAAGRVLAERLRELPDWDRRFDLVEQFLLRRAAQGPRVSGAVVRALGKLWTSDGRVRIETLAAEVGCSRRHLTSQFREQVGLPPKTIARLIRFQYVRRRIEREPAHWAEIAYDAGYSDQPHLNRDFRELAGTTPTDFVARLIPGGGIVGDELPFVQD